MCAQPGAERASATFYDPRTKCCTYTPHLHNFLVGRILRETDPGLGFGKQVVTERIESGVATTPLGLGPSPQRKLLYNTGGRLVFGKSLELRCPYYAEDIGGCGVWRHRDAVCSTFFCKYDRGAVGKRFWNAMQGLLATCSEELAVHCALELGLDDEALARLTPWSTTFDKTAIEPHELDGAHAADYDARWGTWRGRELEYFLACARIVDAMSWEDVLAIAGARSRLAASKLTAANRELRSSELPTALRTGMFRSRLGPSGTVRLQGYSNGDELAAPKMLLDVLPHFDGSPVDDVLARVEAEAGVTLNRELVRKLVDFEILVPADDS